MRSFPVLKAFDLAGSPIDVGDCFGLDVTPDDTPSFTSTVRVGFAHRATGGARSNWWSREINFSEYQLYRWLRERGANDGETVLVCWAGVG